MKTLINLIISLVVTYLVGSSLYGTYDITDWKESQQFAFCLATIVSLILAEFMGLNLLNKDD